MSKPTGFVDPELVPMIPDYLKRRREDLRTLTAHLEAKRFQDLERLAHNIKGTGSAYGFPEVSRLAAELQDAARAENDVRIAQLIQGLTACLSET